MTCQGPYRCSGCPSCLGGAQSKHPDGEPRALHPQEEQRIKRALINNPLIYDSPRPVRLRIVTMPTERPAHDPASCSAMVCDEPECRSANARRAAQGAGPSDPFARRRAA